jgi:hypothetical protein
METTHEKYLILKIQNKQLAKENETLKLHRRSLLIENKALKEINQTLQILYKHPDDIDSE